MTAHTFTILVLIAFQSFGMRVYVLAAQKEKPSVTCNDLGTINPFLARTDEMNVSECVRGVKSGQRFGRRLVLGCPFSLGSRPENRNRRCWAVVVQCDCGQIDVTQVASLKAGKGDLCRSCSSRENATVHGHRHEQLYTIWSAMKQRCNSDSYRNYSRYGGRGIRVCAEWESSYESFCSWALAAGYTPGLSIDRINNDGNYEPSNCQWMTVSENTKKRWRDTPSLIAIT